MARHEVDDLDDNDDNEGEAPMNIILQEAARLRAANERIPLDLARHRVSLDHDRRMQALKLSSRGQPPPVSSNPGQAPTMVPPIPQGTVTLASARAHLSEHLPGFSTFGADAQFRAMKLLGSLAAPGAALLSKQAPSDKPVVLLALYPGETPRARARAFLAATVENWAALPYETQWRKIGELRTTHTCVDVEVSP